MIRGIVAIDNKRGMSREEGLPWHLPQEGQHFAREIAHAPVLMGYGTYLEVQQPFHGGPDYVATRNTEPLRPGFVAVSDAVDFLEHFEGDIWNLGGPGLLKATLDMIDELHLTQVEADYHCTKFLPEYRDKFHLVSESEPQIENGVTYRYQVWQHN